MYSCTAWLAATWRPIVRRLSPFSRSRIVEPDSSEWKSDARSDVYAIGLTLFELVALRPAYEERDRNKLVKPVTTGDPPRLRKLRSDAPR